MSSRNLLSFWVSIPTIRNFYVFMINTLWPVQNDLVGENVCFLIYSYLRFSFMDTLKKISTNQADGLVPLPQHIEVETKWSLFCRRNFEMQLLNEKVWIEINISLKFLHKGPINNIPTLVQIMAWRRPGDKPLSEPMMENFLTHICATRPQWSKQRGHSSLCHQGPLYYHGLTLILIWTTNYIHYKVWDEITYPFPTSTMQLFRTSWGQVTWFFLLGNTCSNHCDVTVRFITLNLSHTLDTKWATKCPVLFLGNRSKLIKMFW